MITRAEKYFVAVAAGLTVLGYATGASGAAAKAATPSSGPCRPVDAAATHFRQFIASVASGTDSLSVKQRLSFNMPTASDTAIVFVSDSTICAQAAAANAVASGLSATDPAPVHVLRVGATRYFVWNYQTIGEFLVYHLFDNNFVFVNRIS